MYLLLLINEALFIRSFPTDPFTQQFISKLKSKPWFQVAMALDVKQQLLTILSQSGDANEVMNQLKRSGRLMEEYFG